MHPYTNLIGRLIKKLLGVIKKFSGLCEKRFRRGAPNCGCSAEQLYANCVSDPPYFLNEVCFRWRGESRANFVSRPSFAGPRSKPEGFVESDVSTQKISRTFSTLSAR